MKVRYTRERGYKGDGRDPWVTLGKTYVVVGISFRPPPYSMQVDICTDDDFGERGAYGYPAVFEMSSFDIVDPAIPSDWCFVDHKDGYYRLTPKEFTGDFWDLFHDADPEAEIIFGRVVEKILQMKPMTQSA